MTSALTGSKITARSQSGVRASQLGLGLFLLASVIQYTSWGSHKGCQAKPTGTPPGVLDFLAKPGATDRAYLLHDLGQETWRALSTWCLPDTM